MKRQTRAANKAVLAALDNVFLAIVFTVVAIALSGCGTVLVKDCEQQGGSQYFHCKRVMTK